MNRRMDSHNDDVMALTELADLLSLLGNSDRLRILQELRGGPRDVASLVLAVGTSQSRTSQHLGLLKAHHLVSSRRDGRKVFYALRNARLAEWMFGGFEFLDTGPTHGAPLDASIEALRKRYD